MKRNIKQSAITVRELKALEKITIYNSAIDEIISTEIYWTQNGYLAFDFCEDNLTTGIPLRLSPYKDPIRWDNLNGNVFLTKMTINAKDFVKS